MSKLNQLILNFDFEQNFKNLDFYVSKSNVHVFDIVKDWSKRNEKFTSAPYSGFINPVLTPELDDKGEIIDIKVEQPESFAIQMIEYAKRYSTLPDNN